MEFHVEQVIHATPSDVARLMFDPDQEERWAGGAAERLTTGPIALAARVRHSASLIGTRGPFVTEVTDFDSECKLGMEIVEGPERGLLLFQIAPTSGGAIAAIHVRNHPKLPIPALAWARKHQVEANLHRLAALLAPRR